jgi:hypothetical protein
MLGSNGGLIGASRMPLNGAASGLWSPEEQSTAARNNTWPAQKYTARYWKWTNFTTNSGLLEISEFRLSNGGSYISGGTWQVGGTNFGSITLANLNNNDLGTRAFQFSTPNAGSIIWYDYGSPLTADGWQYATYFNAGANFVTNATVQISNDGVLFFPIRTFAGLSQYAVANSVLSPVYTFAPIAGWTYRYFRFSNFASTALNGDALDLTEIQFFQDFSLITGITTTSNITWSGGQDSFLTDGTLNATSNRSFKTSWSTVQASSTISFDLGSRKTVTHLRIFSCFTQPRFPASFDLQGSDDGSSYTTLATITVGTPSTAYGTNIFASALITL